MRTQNIKAPGYLALLVATFCAATSAHGQSRDRDFDLDAREARSSARLDQDRPSDRAGFELIFTAPVLYTNFAVQTATEELLSRQGDWHFNPDLLLKWTHQFDWVKLTVGGDIMVDRYFTQKQANEDSLNGTFKAAFTDGRSDLFVPYVSYSGWMDFLPTFRQRDDTIQDFAAGFSSAIAFSNSGGLIPYRDAHSAGDAYVRFDTRVGRRVADPRDFEHTFAAASVTFGYVVSREVEVSIAPAFKARWYDDYFGDFRRDLRPSVYLLVAWTPEWLRKISPRAEIDFTALLERNFSNLPEETYTRWEAGPAVVLRTKF